jgi:hypothetical protein
VVFVVDVSNGITVRDVHTNGEDTFDPAAFLGTYQYADLSEGTIWVYWNEPRGFYRVRNTPTEGNRWYVGCHHINAPFRFDSRQVEIFLHHCLPTGVVWRQEGEIPAHVHEALRRAEETIAGAFRRRDNPVNAIQAERADGGPEAGQLWFWRRRQGVAVVEVIGRQRIHNNGLDYLRFRRLTDQQESVMLVDLFRARYNRVNIPLGSLWVWMDGTPTIRRVQEVSGRNWTVSTDGIDDEEHDDLFLETFLTRYSMTPITTVLSRRIGEADMTRIRQYLISQATRTNDMTQAAVAQATERRVRQLVRTFDDLRHMLGAEEAEAQMQQLLQSLPEDESALFVRLWMEEVQDGPMEGMLSGRVEAAAAQQMSERILAEMLRHQAVDPGLTITYDPMGTPPGPEEESFPRAEALPPDPNEPIPGQRGHATVAGFTRRPLEGFSRDQLLERAQVMAAEDEAVFAALDAAAATEPEPPGPSVWERLMDDED